MAKACDNSVLDGMLNVIKTATRQSVCSGQPANFGAIAGMLLASTPMVAGDYTLANGDTSGRKITTTAKAALAVTQAGTSSHIVLDNGSLVLYVTTCAAQSLAIGNSVNFPAWKIEVQAPT